MNRTFFFFLQLALFFSSNPTFAETTEVSVQLKPVTSINTPAKNDVHPLAFSWDADLYLVNFNADQEQKVRKAVEIIKKVIASREFKDRVLNYKYKGNKGFVDNHGLSNEEIYNRIFEAAEQIGNTTKNNMMDVELELYHQKTNTIGYTYPNTVRIWINKKYFSKYTPVKVADNLMHEWMHKIGFTHATTWSKDRDHSVPYAIGYLIEELAENLPE
jgi:hypothetical protein